MKILCVSDQIDPLVYSSNIRERYRDVEMVISAGDLPMEYLDFIVSSLNKPLLFVFGNHNLEEFSQYHRTSPTQGSCIYPDETAGNEKMCHGTTYVGFKAVRENRILIAGASGSLRYNKGLNQYSDRQMLFKLLGLIPRLTWNRLRYGRWLDILVTHAAPQGIHDRADPCHKGFPCFLWFLKTFKPRYMIHGHIHLYDLQAVRVSDYLSTTVINAYSHYILDTGDMLK